MLSITGAIIVASIVAVLGVWGLHYMPPLVITATVLASVGAGMLFTLESEMPMLEWIGYLALYGLGLGMGGQLAIVGAQLAVSPADVANSISSVLSLNAIGSSIFIFVFQRLFNSELLALSDPATEFEPSVTKKSFAFMKRASPEEHQYAIETITSGVRKLFFIGMVLSAATILALLFIPWKSVELRARKTERTDVESSRTSSCQSEAFTQRSSGK